MTANNSASSRRRVSFQDNLPLKNNLMNSGLKNSLHKKLGEMQNQNFSKSMKVIDVKGLN